jgi:hypothetical protein
MSAMKKLVIAVLAVGMAACSHTTINEAWSKPDVASRNVNKIAVIGMTDRPMTRRILEDEFVREFRDRGVDAEQAYELGTVEEMPHPDAVKDVLGLAGYDAVLMAEPVDVTQRVDFVPGDPYWSEAYVYDPFYDYYYSAYWHYHDPGYYVVSEVVQIETRLYDLRTGELIWSALSSTVKDGDLDGYLKDYARAIVNRLEQNQVIATA